jgi:formylglycine-generating enzyme required for sulfatase activity
MLDPAVDFELFLLLAIRADSADRLLRALGTIGIDGPETFALLPLPSTPYRDVILKPIEVLARRGQRLTIEPALADRLVSDAIGADALPLLAFTLSRLYHAYGSSGSHEEGSVRSLTHRHYEAMGGVGGSIDNALGEALAKTGIVGTQTILRRLIIPHLATWDPEADAAKRLVVRETVVVGDDRAGLEPLAMALVEARLLTLSAVGSEATLEVAHEALLRREPIASWLREDRELLSLLNDIKHASHDWNANGERTAWLAHRGERLTAAEQLALRPDLAANLEPVDHRYLGACHDAEEKARRTGVVVRGVTGVVIALALMLTAAGLAWWKQDILNEQYHWRMVMGPSLLPVDLERSLKPRAEFSECARGCPKMVVVPSGLFMMGSPADEPEAIADEHPRHQVTIAKRFAVGKFEVTFAEWDHCVAGGACSNTADNGWGRGDQPVIQVSWEDAKRYAAWLTRMTGSQYRLLSEAEWEYSARGGMPSNYFWGDDIGTENANCYSCGSPFPWDRTRPSPVGYFKSNDFGLHDMHGNVSEWVEDTWHPDYQDAPSDGSVWQGGDPQERVIRGGSFDDNPKELRSSWRGWATSGSRRTKIGFRIARTLVSSR